jgi:hypothetical protein
MAIIDTLVILYMANVVFFKKAPRKIWLGGPAQVKKKMTFNFQGGIKWLLIGVALSFFPAYVFHDQNIVYSWAVCRYFAYALIYYYLHKRNYKVEDVESVLIVLSLIFQFIYWIEIRFPSATPLFGDYYSELSSGITRLRIYGSHLFMLTFCILISRFKFTAKAAGLVFMALFSLLLLQSRQLLFPGALILVFHFRKIVFKSFFSGLMLISLAGAGVYFGADLFDKVLDKTVNQNSNDKLGGDRLESYIYYLKDEGANAFTRVFGEGYPAPSTPYGDKFQSFKLDSGLSPADIGPVGFVTFFGFLWFIGVIILMYKSIKVKVPSKYVYVKYYVFIVLFTLPVGESQFASGPSIVALMCAYFIIDKGNLELRESEQREKERLRQKYASRTFTTSMPG